MGGPTENIAMAEYAPVPGEDANAEDSVRRATVMCTHNLQCTLRQIGDQAEDGHQCLQTWLFHLKFRSNVDTSPSPRSSPRDIGGGVPVESVD